MQVPVLSYTSFLLSAAKDRSELTLSTRNRSDLRPGIREKMEAFAENAAKKERFPILFGSHHGNARFLSFNCHWNNYEKLFNIEKRDVHRKIYFTKQIAFRRDLHISGCILGASRLTPLEVNHMLRANEFTKEFTAGNSIKSFDTNQLPSNDPIEDMRNEAYCIHNNGYLFGVFDGHGGGACAQVVAKRLYHYLSASLLPRSELKTLADSLSNSKRQPAKILEVFNERFEFVDVLRDLYATSYQKYVNKLFQADDVKTVEDAFVRAFLSLDEDISREALETENNLRIIQKTLSVAVSGAVTCVAYIKGPELHVASVGDCQAVIGVFDEEQGQWLPKIMNVKHNSENIHEVHRILNEHPKSEQDSIIKFDRLLGQLAPLRALGDFRYKWDKITLERLCIPYFGANVVPPNYYTPPYLTARPDLTYHHLTPKDKFLVIATDGLWDFISPVEVVRMVGEHIRGKTVLSPFRLPKENMTLGEINEALLVRKECLKMKPIDRNACTHLLRNALGGTEYGLDQGKLSHLLSLPQEVVRNFRDDISITVIHFDSEYLRHCLPDFS